MGEAQENSTIRLLENSRTAIWLTGWGIGAEETLESARAWAPHLEHHIVLPDSNWRSRLLELNSNCSSPPLLCGYSTGAFLLLSCHKLRQLFPEAMLLAPFLDLRKEADLGGRVEMSRLRYLMRWLARDPHSAVADFRRYVGLPQRDGQLPSTAVLRWGVVKLLSGHSVCKLGEWPQSWKAYLGAEDPLIDSAELSSLWPELQVLSRVSHRLDSLLSGVEAPAAQMLSRLESA